MVESSSQSVTPVVSSQGWKHYEDCSVWWNVISFWSIYLKLPSLFAAICFLAFHNKLHNMKALVILSHNDHHFSYLLVFMKKENCCGSLWALLEYFHEKKLPTDHCFNIGAHIGICAHISRNTLLYLPSLKSDSPILLHMLISLDWQFQEHSIVLQNLY